MPSRSKQTRRTKGRRARSLRRQVAFREQRSVIRIHTEGRITEPEYLGLMSGRGVSLDFGTTGATPMALVQQARQEARKNRRAHADDRFDEIWCVFDCDEHPHLGQALQEARDSGIHTAFSNPCFELWLVLHVENQTAYIHRHAIQDRCEELCLTDGKALVEEAISKLTEGYSKAKERAQSLRMGHKASGSPAGANPSSGVWRLVDRLQSEPPMRPSR